MRAQDGGLPGATVLDEGPVTVLALSGELDAVAAQTVRDNLDELSHRGSVVIDLTDVPFIDSSGLGALIGGIRRLRESSVRVALSSDVPVVRRLLEMTGVDRLAPVTAVRPDAVALVERDA